MGRAISREAVLTRRTAVRVDPDGRPPASDTAVRRAVLQADQRHRRTANAPSPAGGNSEEQPSLRGESLWRYAAPSVQVSVDLNLKGAPWRCPLRPLAANTPLVEQPRQPRFSAGHQQSQYRRRRPDQGPRNSSRPAPAERDAQYRLSRRRRVSGGSRSPSRPCRGLARSSPKRGWRRTAVPPSSHLLRRRNVRLPRWRLRTGVCGSYRNPAFFLRLPWRNIRLCP